MARVRKPCSVEGCENLSRVWGLCIKHHRRWVKYGSTDRHYDPFERFMTQFDLDPSTCWLWTGYVGTHGYGFLGNHISAHKFSYERFIGSVPESYEIDHICHNADPLCAGGSTCLHRRCVNPAHLEAVTHRENVLRSMRGPIALHAAQTHCKRGHPLSGDNLWIDPNGHRQCVICETARRAKRGRRPPIPNGPKQQASSYVAVI